MRTLHLALIVITGATAIVTAFIYPVVWISIGLTLVTLWLTRQFNRSARRTS